MDNFLFAGINAGTSRTTKFILNSGSSSVVLLNYGGTMVAWVKQDGNIIKSDTISTNTSIKTPVTLFVDRPEVIVSINMSNIYNKVDLSNLNWLNNVIVSGNDINTITLDSNAPVSIGCANSSLREINNSATTQLSSIDASNSNLQTITNLQGEGPLVLSGLSIATSFDVSSYVVSGLLEINDSSVVQLPNLVCKEVPMNISIRNTVFTTPLWNIHIDSYLDVENSGIKYAYIVTVNDGATINFKNNDMSAAEVNQMLFRLDGCGMYSGTIDLSGTNAAPDSGSGGKNGLAYLASLEAKYNTVIHN